MLNQFWWTQSYWLARVLGCIVGGWLSFSGTVAASVYAEPLRLISLTSKQLQSSPAYLTLQASTGISKQNVQAAGTSAKEISAEQEAASQDTLCQPPVLSRLQSHVIQPGETLESIAAQYGLIPATLLGFNPSLTDRLDQEQLPIGQDLSIPPYNGVRVQVAEGKTWQDLADQYNVRADVLFELNGCGAVPRVVFVPGVSGLPTQPSQSEQILQRAASALSGFPLPTIAPVLRDYGWQARPQSVDIEFHGGVDLSAEVGTPVLSVGEGVVAFVGEQGDYGQLVVVNHAQGLQTRYAQLSETSVQVGQRVRVGQALGRSGETGNAYAPHLHFEVRSNSTMGWVAQNPADYLEHMRMFER